MERVTKFRYRVHTASNNAPGEEITIEVTPKNFNDSLHSVVATKDGKPFPPEPGTEDNPTFKFNVTKPKGATHLIEIECNFQDDAPDDALYDIEISGEDDVGCPCGFTIDRTTLDQSPDINFRVKA